MVFCPKCGAECPPDSVFCWNCGSEIPKHSQKSQQKSDLSQLKIAVISLAVLAIIVLIILVVFPGNPCRGVTCDDECRGTTLWKMKCIQGECVPDEPIEENSETCGYDPCKDIVCDNKCSGTDLWKMKCFRGECVPDYMIEKNSIECGYEPPPPTSSTPTPTPSPEPELPGLIGWEGDIPIIDWRYADQYYGKYVIVEGTIVDTYNSGKACFLNFHPDWERYFTAVIFDSDFHKFPSNPEMYYKGKKVRVRGVIQEYEGKPEIILEDPSQIEIIG
jgi:predicted nucleic acid-binding Zn ribbon protein